MEKDGVCKMDSQNKKCSCAIKSGGRKNKVELIEKKNFLRALEKRIMEEPSEVHVTKVKRQKGWRASCGVGEAREGLETVAVLGQSHWWG